MMLNRRICTIATHKLPPFRSGMVEIMKAAIVVVAISCLAFVDAKQATSEDSRILGGNPVDPKRYQEFVSIADDERIPRCGGTLIRPDVVLTAAHCVVNWTGTNREFEFTLSSGWEDWTIFKGQLEFNDANTESGWKEMQGKHSSGVRKIVFNSDFDPEEMVNDIALLFLEDKLPRPYAKLPKTGFAGDTGDGAPVTVVGFGRTNNYFAPPSTLPSNTLDLVNAQKQAVGQNPVTSFTQGFLPPVLYGVTLAVGEDDDRCSETPPGVLCLVGKPYDLNQAALYANDDLNLGLSEQFPEIKFTTGHCYGDSGGPAFDKNGVQVGVNSFVENYAGPETDGETDCAINFTTESNNFTKVRDFMGWIRRTIIAERLPI